MLGESGYSAKISRRDGPLGWWLGRGESGYSAGLVR